jgi:hypothetical protein
VPASAAHQRACLACPPPCLPRLPTTVPAYFYKWLKTSLHKPTGNSLQAYFLENGQLKVIDNFKNTSFCRKQIEHLKIAIYLKNDTFAEIFKISLFDT